MTLVRILVDGCGLLNKWPELAPGKSRQSQSAREELIHALTQYHDAESVPITVVFEETPDMEGGTELDSTEDVEVLYARPGQKIRQVLERVAAKLKSLGEITVVSDDFAEWSGVSIELKNCDEFMLMAKTSLAALEREIEQLNQRENRQFSHH